MLDSLLELLGPDAPVLFIASVAALLAGFLAGKGFSYVRQLFRRGRILAQLPQAPGQLPILGNSLQLLTCAWEVMFTWVKARGPIVRVKIFNMDFVLVGSAEGVKRVFQTGQRNYIKDKDMSFKPFLGILGTGLVTSEGTHWQHQRVKVGPLLRYDMLEGLAVTSRTAADRLCEKLEAAKVAGESVEMEEEFRKLTLQIIGEAFLSLPPEECDKVFPELYLPLMTEGNLRTIRRWRMYLPTPAWFRYNRLLASLDSYLVALLKRRWEDKLYDRSTASDLLEKRIAGMMERGEEWNAAMQRQLCYEFKTFLLAGHETSAAMLTWTLYELSRNPGKQAKVLEEAAAALAADDLRKGAEGMPYTLACLKETLRRYSVVPVVTRQAAVDDEICGHAVPKGTYIACMIAAVHQSEWEEPEEWRPERFLPGGEYDSFAEDIRPHVFVPFISGPRNCLGQNFALLEARVVLAVLLQRFKFEPLNKEVKLTQVVIPTGPEGGMHMRVTARC